MRVDPAEAEVILRIFREAAEGIPFTRVAKRLNADHIPGRVRSAGGWTVGSIRRTLENAKYRGHWVWNKRGNRRDRRTGRRRYVDKPESEWVVRDDEALRIVPQALWDRVAERLREIRKVWPGGKGRGFGPGQRSRVHAYPPYLFSGAMVCGCCDRAIALVTGHRGGYYGCSAAARHACGNRVRVPRRVAEKVILGALRDRLLQPEPVSRVLGRVREEVTALCAHVPDMLKRKAAQLEEARRRVARIVNFVAPRPRSGGKALAEALAKDEASVTSLQAEVENLQQASDSGVRFPSRAWIEKRLAAVRELLERRTEASGLVLRRLLGRMVLEPVYPERGAPYYVARTALDVLVLLEPLASDPGSESGASSFGWWRRRVLHFRPQRLRRGRCRVNQASTGGQLAAGDRGMTLCWPSAWRRGRTRAPRSSVSSETGQRSSPSALVEGQRRSAAYGGRRITDKAQLPAPVSPVVRTRPAAGTSAAALPRALGEGGGLPKSRATRGRQRFLEGTDLLPKNGPARVAVGPARAAVWSLSRRRWSCSRCSWSVSKVDVALDLVRCAARQRRGRTRSYRRRVAAIAQARRLSSATLQGPGSVHLRELGVHLREEVSSRSSAWST